MNINVIYDQSQSSLPAGFVAAVNYVVNYFDTTFTNSITVNIDLGYGEIAGQSLGSGALGESETFFNSVGYSQAVNALKANQSSSAQQSAYSTLPGSSPVNGGTLWVSTAEEKALGLLAGNNSAIDGYVGIGSTYPFSYSASATPASGQYYFDGVLAHEFSEVLGRSSMLGDGLGGTNSYTIMDLFRYSAPGARQLGTGGPAYFSINNGTTNLDSWNTNANGDLGDWAGSAGADAFLAFSPSGQKDWITQPDVTLLNVLGWDTTKAPASVTGNSFSVGAGQSVAIASDLAVSNPSGDGIVYRFWDAGGGGHFTVNGTVEPAGQWIGNFSNLGGVDFVGGPAAGSQKLWVQVLDTTTGTWSPLNSFTATTLAPASVAGNSFSVGTGQSVAIASDLTVSNPSGDSIAYRFWDAGGGGHFTVNGTAEPAGQWIGNLSNLGSVDFVGGPAAGSQTLYVQVLDITTGTWSPLNSFTATTIAPASVAGNSFSVGAGQSVAIASDLAVSNPSGASIAYRFWDAGGGGHFTVNGTVEPAGQWIGNFSNLGGVDFAGGPAAGSQTLWVQVLDTTTGTWSPLSSFTATNAGTSGATVANKSVPGSSGTLQLDQSSSFSGAVAGMSGQNTIGLWDINPATVKTPTFLGASSGGTLTVADGANTANIALLVNYMSSMFVASSDGHGCTNIVDPLLVPSNQQILTQPQHA
jgi:uncharacterized membrane protein